MSQSAYSGSNHQSVRQSNRAVVFRAIHALGPIARIELARQTGLNPGTVTHIVEELLSSGLASELPHPDHKTERVGRAGRRPVLLTINPSARLAIGIDLARNAVTGAVVNLAGEVSRRIVERTGALQSDVAVEQVTAIVERLLGELTDEERASVVGVGIGAPGPLSIRSGRFLAPPSYGAWEELEIGREIEARVGIPTSVDNNANTAALGELWFGAGQGVSNFVLLTVGTGVGAGLVLDGDLYRGQHDLAGEIGHVSIAMDGPRCACGNYGCLEMYISVPRILGAVRAAIATGEPTLLRTTSAPDGSSPSEAPEAGSFAPQPDLTLSTVIGAAQQGDALSQRILADVARYLTAGLVNIINTLDPDLVLIGRELGKACGYLLPLVQDEVQRRISPAQRSSVRIAAATLSDAPVIGAAVLALREFFEAPLPARLSEKVGAR